MGGAVRVAVSLANRMVNDYHVSIVELTCHDTLAFAIDERVQIISLGSKEERIRGRVGEVKRLMCEALADEHVDVMLGIGAEETAVAIFPCCLMKIPLVFCDHGALVNQLNSKSTTALRSICSRVCTKTVVLTSQTEADYQRILYLKAKKLAHIPNWIDKHMIEQGLLCDTSSKRLLWAGRLDGEKGIDHLVEIAKIVMPQKPEWTWDIYGEAVLNNGDFNLADEIVHAGLSEQVRLCGRYVDTADVFPRYAIGTLTSYREGLPLFLLEGLAYGMPLISFDIDTGPRDLIDSGVNGVLVEPYDCERYAHELMKMMDDVELLESMSKASCTKAHEFAEDSVYVQWTELIGQCCTQQ